MGWAGSSRVLLEQIHSFLSPWLSQIPNALSSSKKSFWAKNWARMRLWTSYLSHIGVLYFKKKKYLWQLDSAAVASSHSQVTEAQRPPAECFLVSATSLGHQCQSLYVHSFTLLLNFYVCVWMFVDACVYMSVHGKFSIECLPQLLSILCFLICVCVCVPMCECVWLWASVPWSMCTSEDNLGCQSSSIFFGGVSCCLSLCSQVSWPYGFWGFFRSTEMTNLPSSAPCTCVEWPPLPTGPSSCSTSVFGTEYLTELGTCQFGQNGSSSSPGSFCLCLPAPGSQEPSKALCCCCF